MNRHRFVNDGRSPIPMGATADYACICGRRGTRASIERHIAENWELEEPTPPSAASENYAAIVVKNDDAFGGDTKAHYLPVEPREPAFDADEATPTPPELPPPPPISPMSDVCPICQDGVQIADLPEIAAWSCGHWIRRKSRPVAESFQDMLRAAFQAGVAAATSGETFEIWYQHEVLQ